MMPPTVPVVDRAIDTSKGENSNRVLFGRDWLSLLLSASRACNTNEISSHPLEVVWVYEQFRLIDPESYQRVYSRKNGRPLAKGFYIVSWPKGRGDQAYGNEAAFHGPYLNRKEAEASAEMFQDLLLRVDSATGPRAISRRKPAQTSILAQGRIERRKPRTVREYPNRFY